MNSNCKDNSTVILQPTDEEIKLTSVGFFDLRQEQENPPEAYRKFKVREGQVVVRPVEDVDTIVLHQTAVEFGAGRAAIREYGDTNAALARRALNVACHAMAFQDGFFVCPNPLDWYVYHANSLNSRSLGLEIEGLFPGLEADRKTTHSELTPELKAAIVGALDFMIIEGRKMGMPLKYYMAHRQSSMTRRADPGELIWKFVSNHLDNTTDLVPVTSNVYGGRPIPRQWDARAVSKY